MRTKILTVAMATLFAVCAFAPRAFADGDEAKMVGVVTKITMEGEDATTATVVLKDTKSDASVEIVINDELTLDKLKDHRISEGDEIRCKYKVVDGKNVSTYFRKTAGC